MRRRDDVAGREEAAALVRIQVVAWRGEDVGRGPHRDRAQLGLLHEVGMARHLADEDGELGVG